jgi:transposase
MLTKYSPKVKAKAVRLVRDHVQDYESEWAAIKTVSKRLGMTPETVRKWIRQDEINSGQRAGKTSAEHAEIRQLKRDKAELERTVEILSAASAFSLGSWTRNVVDLFVHHRPQGSVRGPVPLLAARVGVPPDLPSTFCAWHQGRPECLLRLPATGTIETGLVGPGVDRGPGRVLRAAGRRRWEEEAGSGVVVWDHENVGSPEPARRSDGRRHDPPQ